ncbi:hypothetical protein T484DRAFT_1601453, partial [Baffinella frigidus]
ACAACEAGTFKSAEGSGTCTDCPDNTYSEATAAHSSNTCSSCPAHTRSDAGSGKRTDCSCVAGYTGSDGEECSACLAGTYKVGTGAGACNSC